MKQLLLISLFLTSCAEKNTYIKLDSCHEKDKQFISHLKDNLKKQGDVISVYADPNELNDYRNGTRGFPKNYEYSLKTKKGATLESIKRANS